jgi:hypothetical protein
VHFLKNRTFSISGCDDLIDGLPQYILLGGLPLGHLPFAVAAPFRLRNPPIPVSGAGWGRHTTKTELNLKSTKALHDQPVIPKLFWVDAPLGKGRAHDVYVLAMGFPVTNDSVMSDAPPHGFRDAFGDG